MSRTHAATGIGRALATAALFGLLVAGIGAGAAGTASAAAPTLDWGSCPRPDQKGFRCASLRVPLDYGDPRSPRIHLAVIKRAATDRARRIGSLFFNPGGPGGEGTVALPEFLDHFPVPLRERFDLVSWDPRGIGRSTAVQCFASSRAEERFLAGVPWESFPVGGAQETRWIRRFEAFGTRCGQRAGALLRHVSTADTARDMNRLRRAVGDSRLNYLGVSYGTILGATYANLFGDRVRALVLDGSVNPRAWVREHVHGDSGVFQSTFLRQYSDRGSAKTLRTFLNLCGQAPTSRCAFSAGGPRATRRKFDALLDRLREGRSGDFAYAELVVTVISSLYATEPATGFPGWDALAVALQDAWTGDERGTLRAPVSPPILSRGIAPRLAGTGGSRYAGIEQAYAVFCSESPNPPPNAFRRLDPFSYERSGSVGPYWSWVAEPCASWPGVAADRYAGPWNRHTASPLLVIGNTADPATPHRGALAMSRQLARARLLTMKGYGHTALLNPSDCVNRYESRYFIAGKLPPAGTTCTQNDQPFATP